MCPRIFEFEILRYSNRSSYSHVEITFVEMRFAYVSGQILILKYPVSVFLLSKGLNGNTCIRGTTPLTRFGSTERVMKAEAVALNATYEAPCPKRHKRSLNSGR